MPLGNLTALSMVTAVYGSTIFQVDDNFVIWQAGIAAKLDNGAWVGSSFETWPGVNPPWNPVSAPVQVVTPVVSAPVQVFSPPPRQSSSPRVERHQFTIAGQSVTYELTR